MYLKYFERQIRKRLLNIGIFYSKRLVNVEVAIITVQLPMLQLKVASANIHIPACTKNEDVCNLTKICKALNCIYYLT